MNVNNKMTDNFRQAYQSCVETQCVNPDHAPFYVRWARAFEDYLPQKRLQDRIGEDVSALLKELARRQNVTEWQVNQARHYSCRTETTCLDWVRRFIAFHAYQDPHSLNTAHAVLTRSVPAYALAIGVPTRVVRKRRDQKP